jgi:hypothetical protein
MGPGFMLPARSSEVKAHLRTGGNLPEQRAVVAEGVGAQDLQVGHDLVRVDVLVHRDDDDLAQRIGHPLPKLIWGGREAVQILRLQDAG